MQAGALRGAHRQSMFPRDFALASKEDVMPRYTDIDGDSGVHSYEFGPDWIVVNFTKGGSYRYDSSRPGLPHVAAMISLAEAGNGLNSYINKHVRKNYAERLG